MCENNEHIDKIAVSTKEKNIIRSVLHCSHIWNVEEIELFRNGTKVEMDQEMRHLAKNQHVHDYKPVMVKGKIVEQNGDEEVIIHLKAEGSRKYPCPHCGKQSPIYDYKERKLHHCDYLGIKCTLKVSVPRLECEDCKVLEMEFPGARSRVSYTYEFEFRTLIEAHKDSISGAARTMHVSRWIVSDVLKRHVGKAKDAQDLSHVDEIFVDDFYLGKKLKYVTIFCDGDGKIIYITKGRNAATIGKFVRHLKKHGGHPDNIKAVSADMSGAYESGVLKYLPKAKLVWDRFHLVKSLNDAVNSIRKRKIKRKKGEKLGGIRYVVLRRRKNMDEKCQSKLQEILLRCPELAQAFDMKEDFAEILSITNRKKAEARFKKWYARVKAKGDDEMKKRAEIFKAKADRIFAWIDHRISNSVAEGVNSRIRKVIGQSYGFRNIDNFISMCMFKLGELTIHV